MLLGIAASWPVAAFYGEPEVQPLLRRPLGQLPDHGARDDAERPPEPRDALPQPRAADDGRNRGRRSRGHRRGRLGRRGVGDHRAAAGDRSRLDDPPVGVLPVAAPLHLLARELPLARRVQRQRLRHPCSLLCEPQSRQLAHRALSRRSVARRLCGRVQRHADAALAGSRSRSSRCSSRPCHGSRTTDLEWLRCGYGRTG